MITLFTTPKDFDSHFRIIQVNALNSWRALSNQIEIIIFGNSKGAEKYSKVINAIYVPEIKCNDRGVPLVSDLIYQGTKLANNDLLMLINSDIILPNDFLEKVQVFKNFNRKFLAIGHRWDINIDNYIDFYNKEEKRKFWAKVEKISIKHSCTGIDYFIFKKGTLKTIPDFTIGRFGWDNWILWHIRRRLIPLIDITQEIGVVHQNHIYKNHNKIDIEENAKLVKNNALNILDSNFLLLNGIIKKNISKSFTNRNLGRLPLVFPEIRPILIIYKKLYRRLFFKR